MRQVALITGASRGIGAATAREFGKRGHHVIVNYRSDEAAAQRVVKDVEAAGGTAHAVQADVCDPAQAARLVDECARLDVLVCNANIQPPFAPLSRMSWDAFSGKVTAELAAVFHVTKMALDVMRGQDGGRIVYVSSVSADHVRRGSIAHATAKAALNVFARHVAAEARDSGIAVNIVAPGAVRTDATRDVLTPEAAAALGERSVLGRVLLPEDVAKVIASVTDGAFQAVAAAHIVVDGGAQVLPGRP
ncbi:SDR family NAD(P)-dependent oxidoreductase [Actinoallomurus sp. NPDC050550]|uniref:SDR family NAD(P)-dependent oxidoreductase n=1 Tax=Actinoallomurus sp. NPDC050550 TaxID=3154937 RepID=UPI0033C2DC90